MDEADRFMRRLKLNAKCKPREEEEQDGNKNPEQKRQITEKRVQVTLPRRGAVKS